MSKKRAILAKSSGCQWVKQKIFRGKCQKARVKGTMDTIHEGLHEGTKDKRLLDSLVLRAQLLINLTTERRLGTSLRMASLLLLHAVSLLFWSSLGCCCSLYWLLCFSKGKKYALTLNLRRKNLSRFCNLHFAVSIQPFNCYGGKMAVK